jgi:hypothetical protein
MVCQGGENAGAAGPPIPRCAGCRRAARMPRRPAAAFRLPPSAFRLRPTPPNPPPCRAADQVRGREDARRSPVSHEIARKFPG